MPATPSPPLLRTPPADDRAACVVDLGKGAFSCSTCGIARISGERNLSAHLSGRRHRAFSVAAASETALEDLESMNVWLARLSLHPAPSKTQARLSLRAVHINLFDLVAERFQPVFATVRELRAYTLREKLVFPKSAAKEGGALRVFLRKMF